jgi:hypothetical protein
MTIHRAVPQWSHETRRPSRPQPTSCQARESRAARQARLPRLQSRAESTQQAVLQLFPSSPAAQLSLAAQLRATSENSQVPRSLALSLHRELIRRRRGLPHAPSNSRDYQQRHQQCGRGHQPPRPHEPIPRARLFSLRALRIERAAGTARARHRRQSFPANRAARKMQIEARRFLRIERMVEVSRQNFRLRTILAQSGTRADASVPRQTSPQQSRHRLVVFPRRHSFSRFPRSNLERAKPQFLH